MKTRQELTDFWRREIKPRLSEQDLLFPVTKRDGTTVSYVNLDNAATTTPFEGVKRKIDEELTTYGSVHRGAGTKSKISTDLYEETRETVKRFVSARSSDYVIFSTNTTTAMNQLAYFFSFIRGKVIVSESEHSSSFLPWVKHEGLHQTRDQIGLEDLITGNTILLNSALIKRGHYNVLMYRTAEDFSFDLNNIEQILKEQSTKSSQEKIKCVVATGASNVTGYKPPLKEIAAISHKYGALFVVDACQLVQHGKLDIQSDGIDFAAFSGHKMYAPYGIGVLVGRKELFDAFLPYQIGGGNLSYITSNGEIIMHPNNATHDPGSPNFVGARAIHHSIRELEAIGIEKINAYEHSLVEPAIEQLREIERVKLYLPKEPSTILTFEIGGMPSKLVAEILSAEYGIGTRAGSFCTYELLRKIKQIGPEEDVRIAQLVQAGEVSVIPTLIRASFSMVNNPDDVARFTLAVKEIAGNGMQPYLSRYTMNGKTGEWKSNI